MSETSADRIGALVSVAMSPWGKRPLAVVADGILPTDLAECDRAFRVLAAAEALRDAWQSSGESYPTYRVLGQDRARAALFAALDVRIASRRGELKGELSATPG